MLNLAVLERERTTKAQAASARLLEIARTCEAEDRLRTTEEDAEIETLRADAFAIDARIKQMQGSSRLTEELAALARPVGHSLSPAAARARTRGMGTQFTESAEYQEFFHTLKGHRAQSSWRSPGIELFPPGPMAATLTEDPASGGALVIPQYLPGILPLPQRRLVVGDAFAQGTTDSNLISYMSEKTFTNAAAAVAEGALKPESTLIYEAITDPVRKLAHWLPTTEEMLEDAPQIRSYIDGRLQLGVQLAEEDELLNGTGVAPHILGLRLRPGLAPDVVQTDPDTVADAILKQSMAIFNTAFLPADTVVMNPADWTNVVLMKSGQGEYLAGGPFSTLPTPTLWGLRVVLTPMIPAAVAVVGAFMQGAQVFRKGGIRVEASNSHADFFIKNLVAIRAEERLALAVYRPAAFGEVTGLHAVVAGGGVTTARGAAPSK